MSLGTSILFRSLDTRSLGKGEETMRVKVWSV